MEAIVWIAEPIAMAPIANDAVKTITNDPKTTTASPATATKLVKRKQKSRRCKEKKNETVIIVAFMSLNFATSQI